MGAVRARSRFGRFAPGLGFEDEAASQADDDRLDCQSNLHSSLNSPGRALFHRDATSIEPNRLKANEYCFYQSLPLAPGFCYSLLALREYSDQCPNLKNAKAQEESLDLQFGDRWPAPLRLRRGKAFRCWSGSWKARKTSGGWRSLQPRPVEPASNLPKAATATPL